MALCLKLFLMRHGKACQDVPVRDSERPLTDAGRDEVRRMGTVLRAKGMLPELVITSPAVRAATSAQAFAAGASLEAPVITLAELYEAGADDLLRLLPVHASEHTSVMLVGHNPAFEAAIAGLADGRLPNGSDVPPGTLAVFTATCSGWEDFANAPKLALLLRPRDLPPAART